jgi:hypothetical protein
MPYSTFSKISFYVVAHADDWQLFMQPNAYTDLVANNTKVVFIITTAGDAGDHKTYWAAREEGCKSSIRFCLASLAAIKESGGFVEKSNHTINYWSANNATVYFFRLPDGNLDGNGFSAYNYQSLSKFRTGESATISAVDNSATYNSWTDLYTTIQSIIQDESENVSNVLLNFLSPETALNPGDHIDHIATGQALQKMEIFTNCHPVAFVGYSVRNAPAPLSRDHLFWKAGMFAAYEKAVHDISGYSTLRESISTYMEWTLSGAKFFIIDPLTSSESSL